MDWIQFVIFAIGVFGLFIWNRTEGRSDIRHMDTKLDSMRNLILSIHEEMKDFHGRLCALEEKYRKGDK